MNKQNKEKLPSLSAAHDVYLRFQSFTLLASRELRKQSDLIN